MRFASVCFLAIAASGALAQDDADDRAERAAELGLDTDTERCIRPGSIRSTRYIDDSTIIFFMGGSNVYINFLPRSCRGLARYKRIAYETSGGRLCRQDRIAVIYDSSGEDIGLPCPLGEFHRIDRESAELMVEAAEQGGAVSPVAAEPVELPPEEDSDE